VTWGGSSSDWKMLYKECPSRRNLIKKLALKSIDIPLCSFMSIGQMMGLKASCSAIGMNLKEETDSSDVVAKWSLCAYCEIIRNTAGATQNTTQNLPCDSCLESRKLVIQHVSNDSYGTMQVLLHAVRNGSLPWITKRNQLKTWTPVAFLAVHECLQKEIPYTPWSIDASQNAKLMARWLVFE